MAQKVTMFRSDSGKSFDSEHDALRDDLHHMLIKSGHINDASATAFVEWACKPRDNLSGLGSVLKSLYDTHPEAPTADAFAPPGTLDCAQIGTNTGHGHVWERPDGTKARCGGPGLCDQCRRDQQLVEACKSQGDQ